MTTNQAQAQAQDAAWSALKANVYTCGDLWGETMEDLNATGETHVYWLETPTGELLLMHGEIEWPGDRYMWDVAATVSTDGELTLADWVQQAAAA